MSAAAVALKTALASGVTVAVDGDDLVLEAAAAPPAALMDALKHHKSGVTRLLQNGGHANTCPPGRAARRPESELPPQWAEAFAALSLGRPIEGFTRDQWHQLIDDTEHFLDHWAQKAAQQGWSVLDAFGVHVRAPAVRYDGMGLVPLIRAGKIVALTTDRATIQMPSGSELTYLRRPLRDAVPIWKVAPKPGGDE